MSGHVYVDETKAKGFIMVAATVESARLTDARRAMRGLLTPGLRRIHFVAESDALRKAVLKTIVDHAPSVTLYVADGYANQRRARTACLRAIVDDAVARDDRMLILERDESLVDADEHDLYRFLGQHQRIGFLRYEHMRAHEEPLLWIPDAIAWCWARGGLWRRSVEAVVDCLVEV